MLCVSNKNLYQNIKIAKKNLLCEMYIPYQVQQCIRGSLALQANDYLRLLSKLVLNA